MKRILATALIVTALFGLAPIFTGCSTPNRTAYIVEGTVINSADTALNVWLELVVAGKVTTAQEVQFRAMWNKYLAAQAVVQKLVEGAKPGETVDRSILRAATDTAAAASADIILFVGQFGKRA